MEVAADSTCATLSGLVILGESLLSLWTGVVPILLMASQLNLHTRCERQIENEINREAIRAGDRLQSEGIKRERPKATHRPSPPSRKYNCHGLTFASRRTVISQPSEIAKILADDDYQKVGEESVLAGDIVIYYRDGDVEHSGIVVSFDVLRGIGGGQVRVPVILSKWGMAHEVVHQLADCPYSAANVAYYRIIT